MVRDLRGTLMKQKKNRHPPHSPKEVRKQRGRKNQHQGKRSRIGIPQLPIQGQSSSGPTSPFNHGTPRRVPREDYHENGMDFQSLSNPPQKQWQIEKQTQDNIKKKKKDIWAGVRSKKPSKGEGTSASRKMVKNTHLQKRTSRRSSPSLLSACLYFIRLLILGIGLGTIAATAIYAVDAIQEISATPGQPLPSESPEVVVEEKAPSGLSLGEEIPELKQKLQALVSQKPQLQAGVFVVDLHGNAYLELEGSTIFASASTIKIPILFAFFQEVDAGNIRLDETLTMKPELIANGSGDMKMQKPGTQFTALETATQMIATSDNTATNMLIERMGGADVLNKRFRDWGLKLTTINNYLPDIEGTNIISPRDLATSIAMIHQGESISFISRDRLLDILKQTQNNTLLPQGLGKGATIAHKTGYIGSMLGDAGLVDLPNGKRYLVVVMVKRPHEDPQAKELIHQISQAVYEHFN